MSLSPPSNSSKRVCTACGTSNTPLWRRNSKRDLVCNACGTFSILSLYLSLLANTSSIFKTLVLMLHFSGQSHKGLYQKANNNKRPDWLKKRNTSTSKTFPSLTDASKIGGGLENMFFFQWNNDSASRSSSTSSTTAAGSAAPHRQSSKIISCHKCGSSDENCTWRKDASNRIICSDCSTQIQADSSNSTTFSGSTIGTLPIFKRARSSSTDMSDPRQSETTHGLNLLSAASKSTLPSFTLMSSMARKEQNPSSSHTSSALKSIHSLQHLTSAGGIAKLARATRDSKQLQALAKHRRTRSSSPYPKTRQPSLAGAESISSSSHGASTIPVPASASAISTMGGTTALPSILDFNCPIIRLPPPVPSTRYPLAASYASNSRHAPFPCDLQIQKSAEQKVDQASPIIISSSQLQQSSKMSLSNLIN